MALTALDITNAETDVQTLAGVVNGASTDPDVINRAGLPIKPLARVMAEIVAAADAIVGSAGYEPPVNYAAALNITRASQTVFYADQTYAALPTAIPFVTGAVFDPAQWRLIVAKQLVSRAEMKATAAANGDTLFLIDGLKTGPFQFTTANIKPYCDGDPLEGQFIKPTGGDGSAGAWVRLYDDVANMNWWGFAANDNVAGGSTDNAPFIEAALASMKACRLAIGDLHIYGYGTGSSRDLMYVGAGYVSRRIVVSHAIHIYGVGGCLGGTGSQLRWPAGTGGWLFDHGSAGWQLGRQVLVGGFDPTAAVGNAAGDEGEFHAVEWKNKGRRYLLFATNWQGDMLRASNDTGTSGGLDNSNSDITDTVFAQYCRSTIQSNGGDVNGCSHRSVKAISNRMCNIWERGFLGAGYHDPESESCGFIPWVGVGTVAARPATLVWWVNKVWTVIGGNEVWCRTNSPPATGDHNQGWVQLPGWGSAYPEATANALGVPTWINNGYYRPGNGIVHQGDSNRSTFNCFTYSEANQINQFDLNVGQITGNIDYAILVNAGSATYFSGTKPPVQRGRSHDYSPVISGAIQAAANFHSFGPASGAATDLDVELQSTQLHFLRFGRFNSDGTLAAYDAYLQNAFGVLVVEGASSVRLRAGSTDVVAATTTALLSMNDNALALGGPSNRFSEAFVGNATINTSDKRLKLETKIDDRFLDAWDDVRWLCYRWRDSIEAKGEDKARIHFGLFAQDVEAALARRGIKVRRYAFFCHNEWGDLMEPELAETPIILRREVPPQRKIGFDDKGIPRTREITLPRTEMIDTGHTKHVPVIDEDTGLPKMKLTRKGGDRFGIRYEQALVIEAMWQRRRADRIEGRLLALEKKAAA